MLSDRSVSNLALTGFMGVGKSTLGRHLATALNYRFVDTDEIIEERSGKKITQIFADHGEPHFRKLEHELVEEMASWTNTVIATGGGFITQNNNLELLKQYSFLVCLWASPTTIYDRVKRQENRPLLKTENPAQKISDLLAARAKYYKQSDYIVHTDKRPLRVVAQLVSRQYQNALNRARSASQQARKGG